VILNSVAINSPASTHPLCGIVSPTNFSAVMRGLDPRIHLFSKGWIAGSSPAMTPRGVATSG